VSSILLASGLWVSPQSGQTQEATQAPIAGTTTPVMLPGNLLTNQPPVMAEPAGPLPSEPVKKSSSAATNDPQAGPWPQVNPALVQSEELIASSNLISSIHGTNQHRYYQIQLELARRQRLEKSSAQAVKIFLWLLESDASEEIKKTALLELALVAQQENELPKAQFFFHRYLQLYPKDASVPEILLRQGLLYRQMGAPVLALSKFYGVMSSALALQLDRLAPYQRLVSQAQTEIADTYYLQGKHEEAIEFFKRLLKLDSPDLNKPKIHFKLVRSLDFLGKHVEAIAQAQDFLKRYPDAEEEAEMRFLLATSLKQLGRSNDALEQVALLLQSQRAAAKQSPETWVYWQQRTGNELANQLYREGDYIHALEVYLDLAQLNSSPSWQVPIWYQVGLVFERLQQPRKASEYYARILERDRELAANAGVGLKAILDMAKWRKSYLDWQSQTAKSGSPIEAANAQSKPESSQQ
jgi:tetratricopeptide (TPR) repeat protein